MAWAALGLTVETAIFVVAGWAWLRSLGYTFAEAAAGGILLVFMGISLIHQISFCAGSPVLGAAMEAIALAAVAAALLGRRPALRACLEAARAVAFRESPAGPTLLGAWLAMGALAVGEWFAAAGPPSLFTGSGASTVLASGSLWGMPAGEPVPLLNAPALFFHTARLGLGPGACGYGVLAHMAIGFSTYALARRYAWPPMALTVTLMVLSMPRLVFLSLHPSAELLSTATIVYALVLIYRLVEQHRPADLRFLLVCLLFSIDSNPMSIALVPVMALLLLVVMVRRHGWLLWRQLVTAIPLATALALAPALVLAQIHVFAVNLVRGHPPMGFAVPWDNDGIRDALANFARYLFVAVDPTEPVRQMTAWLVGLDLERLVAGIYAAFFSPVWTHMGVQAPFFPVFSGAGGMNFGPFAWLLVLPAMIHALVRGPRRLKALAVAWMGYLYLASLMVSWSPENIATLSPLFAANGFLVAFWLPPWRLRRRGMRLLQADFALLLAWSLAVGWRMSG